MTSPPRHRRLLLTAASTGLVAALAVGLPTQSIAAASSHAPAVAVSRSAALASAVPPSAVLPRTGGQHAKLVGTVRADTPTATTPTVTGPVTGGTRGYPFFSFARQPSPVDLAAYGYVEEEFFLEGTASSYRPTTAGLSPDGRWAVEPADEASYRTRLLVIRPADPRRFNGTAWVEWNNVTASFELFPDFSLGYEELLRSGYAYVSVSAQRLAIDPPSGVRTFDPERYASLVHPGDSYSYDIFTQAGQAVSGAAAGVRPLGELRARRVIADGESQSAARMITYINAVQPLAKVYDGFMVHSRGVAGSALAQADTVDPTRPSTAVPSPSLIRTDQPEPVLQVQAETDVVGFAPARQLDVERLRTWEVAGTAHVDQFWGTQTAFRNVRRDLPPTYRGTVCILPTNDGPQHWVFNSAIDKLNRWVRGRAAPANSPVIQVAGGAVQRDRYGIAIGGVRTPDVDAPTRVLSGTGNFGDPFCRLYGTTLPFSPAVFDELYPTADTYRTAVRRSVVDARRLGFVLPRDVQRIVEQAGTEPRS